MYIRILSIVNCLLLLPWAVHVPAVAILLHPMLLVPLSFSLFFVRRVSGIFRSHDCWFGDTAMGHRRRLAIVCIHFLVFQCLCYMHTTKRFGKAGNSCITMTFQGDPIREPSMHYLASRDAHCANCSMRPKPSEE